MNWKGLLIAVLFLLQFSSVAPTDDGSPGLPAPPNQVNASDGTYPDKIAVRWSSVAAATAYNVYYSETAGSAKTLLGQYTGTPVNVTGTAPGAVWYFWVYSVSGNGESATGTYDTGYVQNASALTVSKSGSGSGTVTSSPSGINCGGDCSETYASGISVTLSASPASGSTFGGWSGSCSGTGTCTVSMTQAGSVTARFKASGAIGVTTDYSGLWRNPAQSGHGFSISVLSATRAIVYWYTYDPFGDPIWILGDGEIIGNSIIAKAWFFRGMVWGTWDPDDREDLEWGTFELEFDSCDSATFRYDSTLVYLSGEEFGSGSFPIARLASIDGLDCQ